jgi:hypothetical protein
MNEEVLKDALFSALSLLNSEFDSVEDIELSDQYLAVIEKVENALNEFQRNG